MEERHAHLGFSLVKGIGPARFKLLLAYFGSAAAAWTASEKQLRETGLGQKLVSELLSFRASFNPAQTIKQYDTSTSLSASNETIKVITRLDALFPKHLLEIPDPPIVLYVKGTLPTQWEKAIAVVGTRMPTSYGKQMTQQIAQALVANECLIVSGLARGVDGLAHQAAVDQGKPTVAVLGCGVDIIYPPEHTRLYAEIIKYQGAIVSEVPPGHTVAKGLFPARNRIISGLSRGIVVTEGAEDSGSLITATFAADQGKDVFAVPGLATSHLAKGPLKLLKQGAKLITEAADILQEYSWGQIKGVKQQDFSHLSATQQQVLAILRRSNLHCDEIIRQLNTPASAVMEILTELELSGILLNLGNGIYGLKS